MLSRTRSAVLLGLTVGAVGVLVSLLPFTLEVEKDAGLHWLFELRGPRQPPTGIFLVNIDRPSAEALGVVPDPARWPRWLHAQLIENLAAAGVRVIVFDIFFGEPGPPAEDAALAAAMRAAGNVVLAGRLNSHFIPLGAQQDGSHPEAVSVEIDAPVGVLTKSAVAVAPFLLPAWPVKVSQFWAFHEEAADLPTLPAVALQAFAGESLDQLVQAFRAAGPVGTAGYKTGQRNLAESMQELRELCLAQPEKVLALLRELQTGSSAALPQAPTLRLADLLRLYAGPSSYFLNYYGPPFSIPTIPYHRVLSGERSRSMDGQLPDLRDSIVFIGFAARRQTDQKDGFFSVFSDNNGLNLSGAEIAATATANLLEGRPLRPLAPGLALGVIFVWGLSIGCVCRLLPGATSIAAGVIGASLYLLVAISAFTLADIWAPLMVPLFLQTTLAAIGALLLQFRQAQQQRKRIGAALGRYVPPQLIERLVEESKADNTTAELVHGTCMATDAARYTQMAETLAPDELARVMNAYYNLLFSEVERYGGQVSDVVGDAMMALWASSRPESRVQANACVAALRLSTLLKKRAADGDRMALPTRIGLHSGQIRLGDIGARRHFEYRAIGDIVNTTARIEGLNKHLGTQILASAETLAGVEGFRTREVGTFLLAGKSVPIVVHELLASSEPAPDGAAFGEALAAFRSQHWGEAAQLFRRCLESRLDDGPSRYYLGLCEAYLAAGPVSFSHGAVRITSK